MLIGNGKRLASSSAKRKAPLQITLLHANVHHESSAWMDAKEVS